MKTQTQRINNVIGQLEAVKRMMEGEKDCFAILTQLKAAKAGIAKVTEHMVQDNFIDCVQFCGGKKEQERLKKLMQELVR